MLQSMRLQRVGHYLAIEQQQTTPPESLLLGGIILRLNCCTLLTVSERGRLPWGILAVTVSRPLGLRHHTSKCKWCYSDFSGLRLVPDNVWSLSTETHSTDFQGPSASVQCQ